ncbi:hypothetical protein L4D20_05805 [Vibrio kyushuensis]|uniref:hypothetical protein n=1 Tax=Vibrio kyushuensis TaxID=2910249 RepID=UPI003D0FB0EA
MNNVTRKIEILDCLAGMMMKSTPTEYSSIHCRFEVDNMDESVDEHFWFISNGTKIN